MSGTRMLAARSAGAPPPMRSCWRFSRIWQATASYHNVKGRVMRPVEINLATLATLFRKEFELCNVKKGETIALVTDLNARRDYVAAAFAAAADLQADI